LKLGNIANSAKNIAQSNIPNEMYYSFMFFVLLPCNEKRVLISKITKIENQATWEILRDQWGVLEKKLKKSKLTMKKYQL